jgi:uncharacterized membrane protein
VELFADLVQGPVEFPTTGRLWWTVAAVLLWGVVLGAVVFLVVRILSARSPGMAERRQGMGALEIIRERYVRGEIDQDLYRSMLEDFGGGADGGEDGKDGEEEKEGTVADEG